MKNLISKIRNKKLKGNISLLVILILLASSVIALLSISQIQHLISYGNMTFNYFRAFYLAKAGTELGLAEAYSREAGFEHTINSGDVIVTQNLLEAYSGFNPYFTMDITGKFQYLTKDVRFTNECNDDNMITLGTGEGVMLSLFQDNTSGSRNIFAGLDEYNINSNIEGLSNFFIEKMRMENLKKEGNFQYFTFGLFNYDRYGDMEDIIVRTGNNLQSFLLDSINSVKGPRRYLTIKNSGTGNETASFCINNEDGVLIPYSNYLITVRGNYGNMEVGLQSVAKKEVPSWALNVLDLQI